MDPTTTLQTGSRSPTRLAAVGGFAFTALYLLHRVSQWPGPDSAAPDAVAAYQVDHRATLLAGEVAVSLALLAFVALLAGLVPLLWQAGQPTAAVAVAVCGTLFTALGFMSTAAETALVGVADSGELGAVDALNQLQVRTPVVWAVTALLGTTSLAIVRTGLVWRRLGHAGFVATGVFLLASVSSLLGTTVESNASLIGIGVFLAWMLTLAVGLWRAGPTAHRPGA